MPARESRPGAPELPANTVLAVGGKVLIDLSLMIVVVRERIMDLRQSEMTELGCQLLGRHSLPQDIVHHRTHRKLRSGDHWTAATESFADHDMGVANLQSRLRH